MSCSRQREQKFSTLLGIETTLLTKFINRRSSCSHLIFPIGRRSSTNDKTLTDFEGLPPKTPASRPDTASSGRMARLRNTAENWWRVKLT